MLFRIEFLVKWITTPRYKTKGVSFQKLAKSALSLCTTCIFYKPTGSWAFMIILYILQIGASESARIMIDKNLIYVMQMRISYSISMLYYNLKFMLQCVPDIRRRILISTTEKWKISILNNICLILFNRDANCLLYWTDTKLRKIF